MNSGKQKLELTWIGKEYRPRLEPRILLEDPEKSYHAARRVSENDIFQRQTHRPAGTFLMVRNKWRRELFEAQDQIDSQRDSLIAGLEHQLKQRVSTIPLFSIRWSVE